MFVTPEAVTAEIDYRMEQARDAARRSQARRPSRLRRLMTRTPRAQTSQRPVTRGTPLSART